MEKGEMRVGADRLKNAKTGTNILCVTEKYSIYLPFDVGTAGIILRCRFSFSFVSVRFSTLFAGYAMTD